MKKAILSLGFCLSFSLFIFAQNSINSATKSFDKLAYIDAIKVYEKVVEKGYVSEELFQKLGDAYYFNAQYDKAVSAYQKLFSLNANQKNEYYYRYAISLKSVSDYANSDAMLEEFYERNKQDSRAKLFDNNKNYLQEIANNSGRLEIDNANINSIYSDYGTAFYKNQIVFATARSTGNLIKRVHTWTGEAFTTLYQADLAEDGSVSNPKKFSKHISTKFHESTPVFTKDGKTMYFTRNNFNNGKKLTNTDKTILLKIYKATLINDKWDDITELPFNSNQYNVAHPALSVDEKTLYFVSDMPGTIGKSDIYKVDINSDGSFGKPINLGPSINTEGRESFPFISQNNELYFSSDGRPGLGGLDIYIAFSDQNGNFKNVQNIGEPANSTMDDFSFVIKDNIFGFFTSNRSGGIGNDDIYKFVQFKSLKNEHITSLNGKLTDITSNQFIPNATLTIYDENYQNPLIINTNNKGEFNIPEIEINKKYIIKIIAEKYQVNEIPIILSSENNFQADLNISLKPTLQPVKVGDDLAKTLNIEIIYFDLDKHNIHKEAAKDLAKIVEVMREYPNMKIDVRSHTDSRASKTYNETLSDKRAKSTIAWIIQQGINKNRLTGKGYGESELLNECSDGVNCTEEKHQKNRRSEFIITEM